MNRLDIKNSTVGALAQDERSIVSLYGWLPVDDSWHMSDVTAQSCWSLHHHHEFICQNIDGNINLRITRHAIFSWLLATAKNTMVKYATNPPCCQDFSNAPAVTLYFPSWSQQEHPLYKAHSECGILCERARTWHLADSPYHNSVLVRVSAVFILLYIIAHAIFLLMPWLHVM